MQLTKGPDNCNIVFGIQYTSVNKQTAEWALAGMEGITSYGFGLTPFSDEMVDLEAFPSDKIVVPLGATKLVTLYQQGKLPKNWHVFYDEAKFDQRYCMTLNSSSFLLNASAEYMELHQALDVEWSDDVFVKPTNDLKMFGGFVVPKGLTLRDKLRTVKHQKLDESTMVLVSDTKKLYREFRTIVAYGEIVGVSIYNINGTITHQRTDDRDRMRVAQFIGMVQSKFEPAPVYTIDIAEVDSESHLSGKTFKVVEYNCFNCSGLYTMDPNPIYKRIIEGLEKAHG